MSVRGKYVALGCAQLGDLYGGLQTEVADELLEVAWDVGIRRWDTAPLYGCGVSERRLGHALGGRSRDEVIITSKVGRLVTEEGRITRGGVVPGQWEWDYSPDGLTRGLEASLDRLQVDFVDVALLHDPQNRSLAEGAAAVESLAELKASGLARQVGVGTGDAERAMELLATGAVDVLLLAGRYTLLEHAKGERVLELADKFGTEVVLGGVFNSGLLASNGGSAGFFEYSVADAPTTQRVQELLRLCERFRVPLRTAAIRFALEQPLAAGIVVGADSAAQVRQIVADASADVDLLPLWAELGRHES